MTMEYEKAIRNIPDYPKPGINFKDITPLLLDHELLRNALGEMTRPFISDSIDFVVGIESRGFLFGPPIAQNLQAGFIPVRKPGKLPGEKLREEYTLEYGTDALEMHSGQLKSGSKVLIVDDLLATGGTTSATLKLVERGGGEVVGFSFLIELSFLKGRSKLEGKKVFSLITYDGE
jgi:adenine phosphoribosyltransferase